LDEKKKTEASNARLPAISRFKIPDFRTFASFGHGSQPGNTVGGKIVVVALRLQSLFL
jgi:hypothetical protein